MSKVARLMGGRTLMLMSNLGFKTEYENYPASNQDQVREFFGSSWAAQTFTVGTTHIFQGVVLDLFKEGADAIVTVSIRATTAGDPSGSDLSVTTFNTSSLPVTTSTPFFIPMPNITLTATVVYAIVVRRAGGDSSNSISWDEDGSSPTYAGGSRSDSANSGSTWTAQTGNDFIFEEWGYV